MNLLTRIKDVIVADLHNMVDEKEKKNPASTLNQFIRSCESEVKKVEVLIKRQGDVAKKFAEEKEYAEFMLNKREHQVMIASRAEEKELEDHAISEVAYYKDQVSNLTSMLNNAKNDELELQHKHQKMQNKLKEMHNKRLELMSRENMAHASHRATTVLSEQVDKINPFSAMEEQMNRLEKLVKENDIKSNFDSLIANLERELNIQSEDE